MTNEVIPLRNPVIPRIRNLVKKALDANIGPRLVCQLNKTDMLLFEREAAELCTVARPATEHTEATVHVCGVLVRVGCSCMVPDGAIWISKEPETPGDILRLLYDKERVDAFMKQPVQLEDAQILEFTKSNG